MQKVRIFAKCFKTWYNCRVWINPNFKLDFSPKVLTNLFKTTSTAENMNFSCSLGSFNQEVSFSVLVQTTRLEVLFQVLESTVSLNN
jgi:hypothetical protein